MGEIDVFSILVSIEKLYDFGLGGGFCQVLQFPPQLTTG